MEIIWESGLCIFASFVYLAYAILPLHVFTLLKFMKRECFSVLHICLQKLGSVCALDVDPGWKNSSPHLLY